MARERQPQPPRPPDLSGATFRAVYRAVLPWILGTWAIGLALPGPGAQHLFLTLGASTFYGAASARALGLHPGWRVAVLAVDRAFTHLTALLMLVALSGLAAAVGATLGGMVATAAGLEDERILALPGAALAALPILWWHWPAGLLAYLVPEDAGYRIRAGRAWRGPRYGDARRLVRRARQPARVGLMLGFLCLWAAVLVVAGDAGDRTLFLGVQAATYLVVIPLLLTWGATEILAMIGRVEPAVAGDREKGA
jgi:hypothetical protein